MGYEAYSRRDLQVFLAILNQEEAKGVIDLRVQRQRLYNFLAADRLSLKKEISRLKKMQPTKCPECGSLRWRIEVDESGVQFRECKACRFSELVE